MELQKTSTVISMHICKMKFFKFIDFGASGITNTHNVNS